jgi:hypothetical protein
MSKKEASKFPHVLLSASLDEKMRFFRNTIINHPNIDNAQRELMSAISMATSDSLIFVFGPAGVGKSTLCNSTTNKIIAELLPELESDVERIPIVSIELPAPGPRKFDWRETFRLLLQELQEPLIDRKCAPRTNNDHAPNDGNGNKLAGALRLVNRKPAVNDYRHSYETSLRHRRPVAVLLDDAHYMSKVSGGDLLSQLDLVKSLASRSGRPHILFGTYELLAMRNLSGQISRRSVDIHLRRYTAEDSDQDNFASAVASLCARMPLPDCPTLDNDSDYLFERSAGCVGVLKTWMAKALHHALLKGLPTVTLEHMEQQTYSDAALTQMLTEIVEGEKRVDTGGLGYVEVKKQFFGRAATEILPSSQAGEKKPPQQKPRTKKRVGERQPTRDPIGMKSHLYTGA